MTDKEILTKHLERACNIEIQKVVITPNYVTVMYVYKEQPYARYVTADKFTNVFAVAERLTESINNIYKKCIENR